MKRLMIALLILIPFVLFGTYDFYTVLETLNPFNWFNKDKPNPEAFQNRLDRAVETVRSVDAWSLFEEAFKNAPNSMQNLFEETGIAVYFQMTKG